MATKWKNFTRNSWVKAVCWLLIFVMTAVSAGLTVYAAENAQKNNLNELSSYSTYSLSDILTHEQPTAEYLAQQLYFPISNLYTVGENGTTEENIEKNVMPADLLGELTSEYYQSDTWESDEPEQSYDASAPTLDAETVSAVMAALASDTSGEYSDISESAFQAWLTHHPEVYASCRARYISAQLQSLTDTQKWLEGLKNSFDYYLTNTVTGDCFTSLPDGTTQESAESQLLHTTQYAMALKSTTTGAAFYSKHTDLTQELESLNASDYTLDSSRNGTAICAMTTDAYDNLCLSWSEIHRLLANLIIIYAISAVVIALCLLVLCFGAGRRPDDDTCYLLGFDRIWTEVQIFFGMCACIAFAGVISLFLNFFGDNITVSLSFTAICTGVCAASVAFAAVCLVIFLSQVRRLKARQWLNGWIIWRLFRKFGIASLCWLNKQFRKSPLRRRFIILSILLPLLCATWIPIPVVIVVLLIAGMRLADSIEAVNRGAHDIRAGKTDTQITVREHAPKELAALAADLNGISEGLQEAVDTAVKSERLKSELISNVSHDIKTPLTSIVTYVDLLKKCDIADETAQEYIRILEQKARRLRTLTLDLFDASKATSGAMTVELAKTDLDALLRQALGERSEHIQRAGLDVRITSHPPVYVNADGRLLWRVLDNLISNCVRYAVPHSRVYADIAQGASLCTLTIKNISATELNISADELMQRFTRGDRSRHTEGSGLGLSIAQSLAELMHGTCRVEIDGDLFKAIVEIPRWTQPETHETNQTT